MFNYLRKLIKPKYSTLNKIEIKAANIISNYRYLKSLHANTEIFPVLKSNAYGHGLKELAKIINQTKAPLVAVDSFPEAQIVYHYFKRNILILGEMPLKAYRYLHFSRTEIVVYNQTTLKYLARFGKKIKIHLFVNSGMNREGIKDLKSFIIENKKYLDKVQIVGFCSHLASADLDSKLNKIQEDKFISDLEILRSFSYFPKWIHLGNSAALFKIDNKYLTAYRSGLALYGYDPLDKKNEFLKPALDVFSKIIGFQNLNPGESVSYEETYRASKKTRIALIPFGYFEGLDRRFSNQAEFTIENNKNKFKAKIAGQVCMNLCSLDIGSHLANLGDRVKIISSDSRDSNSVAKLATAIGVIPYELLIKLQSGIRREVV